MYELKITHCLSFLCWNSKNKDFFSICVLRLFSFIRSFSEDINCTQKQEYPLLPEYDHNRFFLRAILLIHIIVTAKNEKESLYKKNIH